MDVARVFRIWGDLEMGVFRILKRPNHLEMVGPFQDPENAQGHGRHLPPKAVKPWCNGSAAFRTPYSSR